MKNNILTLILLLIIGAGCKKNNDAPYEPPVVKPDLTFFAVSNSNQ